MSLLLICSFHALSSSEELLRWHEGVIERNEEKHLGVTLTVNDSLAQGVLVSLHVHIQLYLHILKDRPSGKEGWVCGKR